MECGSYDADFLLKNLMDNMTDKIYFKDLQSRFIMLNNAAAKWHGYQTPSEAFGKSAFDKYTQTDARSMFEAEQRIIETGEPIEGLEEKETQKNGQVDWVSTTKMPLRDSLGNTVGTFGVSRDITARKEAELQAIYYADQIRRIKEEMEEEVRMAAELQKTFFPRSYPTFPKDVESVASCVRFYHRYQASGMVSGDFCTIQNLSETQSGILLCDVMGHGVRAALGTALIYAMAEDLMHRELDPGCFLKEMNKLLLPILQQEDIFLYATACYGVFDAATGKLRMANAGHPLPLHFQRAKKRAEWLIPDVSMRGPALAIIEESDYATIDIQLDPGDTVVLYTDGLYEIENPDHEEFGEDRLIASAQEYIGLPLPELFDGLINASAHFSKQGVFNDDVCLVGLTYQKPMELSNDS